jgi:hypothetical protein
VQIGSEVMRVKEMPRSPDDDVIFENFNNQRIAYFGTTPEAHAIDSPVYKVQVHPAGARFTPNGLPLARLYARNDDGGPGYGKDSLLRFTAPMDGEFLLRLTDVRGPLAKPTPYRLTARRPEPDFRLSIGRLQRADFGKRRGAARGCHGEPRRHRARASERHVPVDQRAEPLRRGTGLPAPREGPRGHCRR